MKLRITAGRLALEAELRDTPTSRLLMQAVPFEASAQTWGEEVYFTTPVSAKLEADAKQVVEPGTVCFWTEGDALALPYGRTPISTDERPKLAARCNVLGTLTGDARRLGWIKAGQKIRVEKI
ncbi:MAG TPA: cyclophilin-like fold protein [Burkholderiales bacterium]|nr:cyclophilin-like fold protein [Burkholderiales bacterium]